MFLALPRFDQRQTGLPSFPPPPHKLPPVSHLSTISSFVPVAVCDLVVFLKRPSPASTTMPIATPDEAEVASSTKAVAVDYDKILSPEASARYPSPLKRLAGSYLGLPGIINFGGGLPAPSVVSLFRGVCYRARRS